MSDIGYPSKVENSLLNTFAMEKLQDLVDREVSENGEVDMWPEHWEESGAIDVWKCLECNRLYLGVKGKPENVVVYKTEQTGIDPDSNIPGSTSVCVA
jgi:hypothetical protein